VQASAPAVLRVGGRRYKIGSGRRRISVALPRRPVTGIIKIPFQATPRTGAATGKVTGRIEARRR
jgi:hypothetical protein